MRPKPTPNLEDFLALAQRGNVIPVVAEFIADGETPVSVFKKLDRGGYSFLLESTEKNDSSARFSFVGVEPRLIIQSRGSEILLRGNGSDRRFHITDSPLDELRRTLARYQFVSRPDLPPFSGGAVGFLGYEAIHSFEATVPLAERDELQLPQMLFLITSSIVVFDHRLRSLKIIAHAFLEDGAPEKVYAKALDSISAIRRTLARPLHSSLLNNLGTSHTAERCRYRSNFPAERFKGAVAQAKEYIRSGDVFQVVLSQRFKCDFHGDALDVYRCLRFINPSPYMFCLKFANDFTLIGSSPEMHVRLIGNEAEMRPVAGTRPRGANAEEDQRNAADLLADPKERAEHVMLVDLARNDIGRVAEFGSVRVAEFMKVERYSHVMHIVSNVTGRLRPGCTAFDLVKATFPAGTVSGAPKIRAMQIIGQLEKTTRGCYAGMIGYFGFDGNIDSCIALRSVILKDGKAYFQAGAGVVADSDPNKEYEETLCKARAMAEALAMAGQMPSSPGPQPGFGAGLPKLRQATLRLLRGENLSRIEATDFLRWLLEPSATDTQVAAALVALAAKGETADELAGMAEAMRKRATPLHSAHRRFIDTAGTGSSQAKTFNVSTAAAFVIAGAGLPVAKHGARAATSVSGSADLVEALGIRPDASLETVERCLNKHGICFMFAPLFHRAAARVAAIRRELGVPTTFNLLGPLTNPARAPVQIVGVANASLLGQVAAALALLGVENAWVVHGADGLDEITLAGETLVAACRRRADDRHTVRTFTISPRDFGLQPRSLEPLRRNAGPIENAKLVRAILAGERHGIFSLARDLVIVNAAAALHIAGLAPDLRQAAALASESIDRGRAEEKLQTLVDETNRKE
jgi:anthranilate synthase component 1